MTKLNDLTGMRFGMLTVIDRAEDHVFKSGARAVQWNCICDCGNKVAVLSGNLVSGNSTSCGCHRVERTKEVNTKHGGCLNYKGERLYGVWKGMIRRCSDVDNPKYYNYGGRGIKVCNEWLNDYGAFRTWALQNGYDKNAPKGECTIDRIDVNGDYCPENCRWANMKEQSRNKTCTIPDVEYMGEKRSLKDWSEITGINYPTLRSRIVRGWSPERAFTTPINPEIIEAKRKGGRCRWKSKIQ